MMNNNKEITQTFIKLVNKLQNQNKNRAYTIGDVKIFPSEAHLMLFINEEQEKNVTSIAEKLGITKGAVSTTLSRLKKKGLITTERDVYNKNQLIISFSESGIKAVEYFSEIKRDILDDIGKSFSKYNEGEKKAVLEFLSNMVDGVGRYI